MSKTNRATKLQSKIIRQRDRLRARLGELVRACVSAKHARAYAEGKASYCDEISKSCMAAARVLEEDFPERPKFDFSSVPRLDKKCRYTCSKRWFCRQVVACLLDYRIGEAYSSKKIAQYRDFLNRVKIIALDTLEEGHQWFNEENIEDKYIKISSHKGEGCDPYVRHSLMWLVGEFCRYLRDFPIGYSDAGHISLYKEVSSALVQSCLISAGVDIFDTEAVFAFLSEKTRTKDLVATRI